jgi:hypothetical protein
MKTNRFGAARAAWVLAGVVGAAALLGAADGKGEFKELFNGKDLSGWEGDERFWSVKDGAITGQTTAEQKAKHNTFLVYKGGTVKDFELHLKFKLGNHNSGVQYRAKALPDHVVTGYQADIADGNPNRYTGILYEEKGRGIIAERGQRVTIDAAGKKEVESIGDRAELGKAIKADDWNDYVIVAKGNHLTHTINGTLMVDVTDDEEGKAAREGILALQIHQGPPMVAQFKDIRLKELKGE